MTPTLATVALVVLAAQVASIPAAALVGHLLRRIDARDVPAPASARYAAAHLFLGPVFTFASLACLLAAYVMDWAAETRVTVRSWRHRFADWRDDRARARVGCACQTDVDAQLDADDFAGWSDPTPEDVAEDARHNPLAEGCRRRGSGWLHGQRCLTCTVAEAARLMERTGPCEPDEDDKEPTQEEAAEHARDLARYGTVPTAPSIRVQHVFDGGVASC